MEGTQAPGRGGRKWKETVIQIAHYDIWKHYNTKVLCRSGQDLAAQPKPTNPKHPFSVGRAYSGPTGYSGHRIRFLLVSLGRFRMVDSGPAVTESDRPMPIIGLLCKYIGLSHMSATINP
jgi:hypothetical protein